MIWVAIVLAALALVALLVFALASDDEAKGIAAILGTIGFVIAIALTIVSSVAIIDAGQVGITSVMGKVDTTAPPLDSGIHFGVNPFSYIKRMSNRTDTYNMSKNHNEGNNKNGDDSIEVITSNGMKMPMDIAIPYKLVDKSAPWVYKNLGSDWVDTILRKSARAAVLKVCARHTDQEVYSTKRDEIAEKIRVELEGEIGKVLKSNYNDAPESIIQVSQILIGRIEIPESVRQAIERKLSADQEQQAMEFRILREKKEAERKKIEAEGIQAFQEIVTKGINENLLRWKAIEATEELSKSQNSKIVIIGQGKDGLPVILGGADGK